MSADLIQRHYDASRRGDLDGMLAPLAPDATWIEAAGFPYAGTYVGAAAITEGVFARVGADWQDFRFDLEELVDGGETVVGVGTYAGTFRATGRSMRARAVHVWHVRGDRAVRFEQIVDTVSLVAAMAGDATVTA